MNIVSEIARTLKKRTTFSTFRHARSNLRLERLEERTVLSASPQQLAALLADPMAFDPSRILVRFRSESAAQQANHILPGAKLGPAISLVPGAHSVHLPAHMTVAHALGLFAASPLVLYAEPNGVVRTTETIPDDAEFARLYGMRNTGQTFGLKGADIKATFAWDVAQSGTTLPVADIDTGIDYNHPDLYRNIWLNQAEIPATRRVNLVDLDFDGKITFWDLNDPLNQGPGKITDQNGDKRITGADILQPLTEFFGGWADGVDQGGNGKIDDLIGWNFVTDTNDPRDDNRHGTHTTGTIGAIGDNGVGVAGVIWKAQIAAVKFLNAGGSGSWEAGAEAISYTVGLGIPISSNSWGGTSFSQILLDSITGARDAGHLFVAAAGNNSANNDIASFYPANYGATLDNVISVAATDHRDLKAGFSNYGANRVHLGAPGVNTYSTTPNNGYGNLSGTSMACPHVAGAVALVWNQYAKWNYLQVKDQILGTVDPIPALQGRTVTGGRLNVFSALTAIPAGPRALGITPSTPVLGPVSSLRVAFDRGINPATFTPGDIANFEGPGGAISVTGVSVVPGTNNTRFDVAFGPQDAIGEYTMVLGPDIQDDAGNAMDQNRNGTPGEIPDDQFTARFRVLDPCLDPDGYGYQACVHPFVDESIFGQSDTFTILNATNDASSPVDLGENSFTLYGVTYTGARGLHVSSNGLISLSFANPGDTNTNLALFPLQATIAVLWDDLIKTGTDPMVLGRFEDLDGDGIHDRLVIEWYEVQIRPSSMQPITFQAHLYLNTDGESDIIFNYFNLDTGDGNRLGAAATIGIKAAGFQGPNRNVVSFNRQTPYVQSNQALRFQALGSLPSIENPLSFEAIHALQARSLPSIAYPVAVALADVGQGEKSQRGLNPDHVAEALAGGATDAERIEIEGEPFEGGHAPRLWAEELRLFSLD